MVQQVHIADGEPLVLDNEVLDDLQCGGLTAIQDRERYCFSSDSALLANFAKVGKQDRVCELCAGSGVVSLLVAHKKRPQCLQCVEWQPLDAYRAARAARYNALDIGVWCGDAVECHKQLGAQQWDVVLANPPYFPLGTGAVKQNDSVAAARYEVHITLEQLVEESARLLRYGGRVYYVYNANRLAELLQTMQRFALEPKELILVLPAEGKAADTVLVAGKKGAKQGIRCWAAVRSRLEEKWYE